MLTIVKIEEGFMVVDINEDTEIFETIEEAEEICGQTILEARSDLNRRKNRQKRDIMTQNSPENFEAIWQAKI
jgi:hypothetical protein